MPEYLIANDRIGLRLLEEADVTDRYLKWFADEDITRFLSAKNLSKSDVIEHLKLGRSTGNFEMLAICDLETNMHIGNLKVGPIDWDNRTADLPIVIGDKRFQGKGLAGEAVDLGSVYAFKNLSVRKVCGSVISGNKASLACYKKGGWHIEGIIPEQYDMDGVIYDEVFIARYARNG